MRFSREGEEWGCDDGFLGKRWRLVSERAGFFMIDDSGKAIRHSACDGGCGPVGGCFFLGFSVIGSRTIPLFGFFCYGALCLGRWGGSAVRMARFGLYAMHTKLSTSPFWVSFTLGCLSFGVNEALLSDEAPCVATDKTPLFGWHLAMKRTMRGLPLLSPLHHLSRVHTNHPTPPTNSHSTQQPKPQTRPVSHPSTNSLGA